MVSGATAGHEHVHGAGCVDKPDISKDAVGGWEILDGGIYTPDSPKDAVDGWEIVNGSVGPADLVANAKARM